MTRGTPSWMASCGVAAPLSFLPANEPIVTILNLLLRQASMVCLYAMPFKQTTWMHNVVP